MSKNPFADYKIAFEKFLKSENGEIYVRCNDLNEAVYGLQELMSMVDYNKYGRLAFEMMQNPHWDFHKENTVFSLSEHGGSYTRADHLRELGKKIFSYQGFDKRMKYFMYIDGKEGSTK